MPTDDPRLRLDAMHAREVVEGVLSRTGAGDGIGVEVELFPITTAPPTRRLPIAAPAGEPSVEAVLATCAERDDTGYRLESGARVTLEPGGQVEVSSSCCRSVDEVLEQVGEATGLLADRFDDQGAVLAAAGTDVWHDLASVPQQLTEPRYPAMAAYLDARSTAGALMMRHTCAIQVNLDLGPPQEAPERWAVANLLAPVLTATFAMSPSPDGQVRSVRSLAWRALDPTRTGFPPRFLTDDADLPQQVLAAAMDADVMMVRRPAAHGQAERAEPGRAGWSFGGWLRDGDARFGWPTADDLRYHLTTLFHEVRARGPLELRSIDSLPHRWRSVPVVLTVGALLDPDARARIADVLAPRRPQLPALLRRAAITAVSDPELCALAVEVWSFALAGARRLAGIEDRHLTTTERFLDRYTLRGRCPADELSERLGSSTDGALTWVGEPASSSTRSPR